MKTSKNGQEEKQQEKQRHDPFSVCYLQANSIKRLSIVSSTFCKFLWNYKLCLPHECLGVLMGKTNDVKQIQQKDVFTTTKIEPYCGDESVMRDANDWFRSVRLCYDQKRLKTLQTPILILYGNTGCGKTFLLNHLVKQCALHLQPVSISKGIHHLHTMMSSSNLISTRPILHLQDVSLFPTDWISILHTGYKNGDLHVPIVIEMDSDEYFTPRYKTKEDAMHKKSKFLTSVYSFWKNETFVKHLRIRVTYKHVLSFLNWKCGRPKESDTLKHIALCANGDFRIADQLIKDKNAFSYELAPRFRTLFDVGAWLFQNYQTKRSEQSSTDLACLLTMFGSEEPNCTQLNLFFRNWIHWIASSSSSFSSSLPTGLPTGLTECVSWSPHALQQLLKAEDALFSFAQRKGYISKTEEPTMSWCIRRSEHGFLHFITKHGGVERFITKNNHIKQKESKCEQTVQKVNVKQKDKLGKPMGKSELNALCVLSRLSDLNSEWDAYSRLECYDHDMEQMQKARILNCSKRVSFKTIFSSSSSSSSFPYKKIMGWFRK